MFGGECDAMVDVYWEHQSRDIPDYVDEAATVLHRHGWTVPSDLRGGAPYVSASLQQTCATRRRAAVGRGIYGLDSQAGAVSRIRHRIFVRRKSSASRIRDMLPTRQVFFT